MSENKAWIAVNHGGSFVKDGSTTKYVAGSLMMLQARVHRICFAEFIEDICAGLHRDDVTRVFYEAPNEVGSYLLLYDDSSLSSFIYHFLENRVVELFVEHDHPTVVGEANAGEGGNHELLPWYEPELSTEAEIDTDHDETICEWSETDTTDSNEIISREEERFSEAGVVESRTIDRDVIADMGVRVDGWKNDDDTEYANTEDDLLEEEECDEKHESEGLGGKRKRHEYPRFDPSGRVPVFAVGMVFDDVKQFKEAVDRHSIYEQRGLWYQRNSFNYLRVKCVDAKCPWNLTASMNHRIRELQIKVYKSNHICQPVFRNKRASSKWLGEEFRDIITSSPSITASELKELVKKHLGLNITLSKARRMRERVLVQLKCDYEKEYERLWDYAEELKKTNNTVVVEVTENIGQEKSDFKRMYVCFEACKQGFLSGCRRVIGVDGCFLTGLCKGQILTAVGRDANNGMFPIAWAVVETENEVNWNWFLGLLSSELHITDKGEGWTFISDRQKGLVNAVSHVFPKCEHRYCARHLSANWRAKHPARKLNTIFWACVKSSNMADFRQNMETLQAYSPAAFADVKEVDFCHWVKAYFRTDVKCDAVENNMCKAFNGEILTYRSKSIITMLEAIRGYVMERMEKQRSKASEWVRECSPRALEKLDEARYNSRFCKVKFAGDRGFEVEHRGDVYVVDVNGRKCTCGLWQVRGIPCSHGVSAIHYLNHDVEEYIDSCYKKDAFLSTYRNSIPLIPSMRFWEGSGRLGPSPPIPRPKRGRPKKKRRKEAFEIMGSRLTQTGQVQKCSRCGGEGHNKRACKGVGCPAPTRKVRKTSSQQLPNISVPPKSKRTKGLCGYGIYFDQHSEHTILNPGIRSERVMESYQGGSSSNVNNEAGSQSTVATCSRIEVDPGIITQEPIRRTIPPSTPMSRRKLPVRRGPVQKSNSKEQPQLVDLED